MPCPHWLSREQLPSTSGTQSGVPPAVADCRTHGSGTSPGEASCSSATGSSDGRHSHHHHRHLCRALTAPSSTQTISKHHRHALSLNNSLKYPDISPPFQLYPSKTDTHSPTCLQTSLLLCLIHVRHALNKVLGAFQEHLQSLKHVKLVTKTTEEHKTGALPNDIKHKCLITKSKRYTNMR